MTKQLKPRAKVNQDQIRNSTRKKKKERKKFGFTTSTQQTTWKIAPQHYLMPCKLVSGRTYWVKSNWEKNMIDVISYKFASLGLLVHGVWCKWQ